jgi:hypothetical protein
MAPGGGSKGGKAVLSSWASRRNGQSGATKLIEDGTDLTLPVPWKINRR